MTNEDLAFLDAWLARSREWEQKWIPFLWGEEDAADTPEGKTAMRERKAIDEEADNWRMASRARISAHFRFSRDDSTGKITVNLFPRSLFPSPGDVAFRHYITADPEEAAQCGCSPWRERYDVGVVVIHRPKEGQLRPVYSLNPLVYK